MTGTFRGGAARADITPSPGPVLQGHWGAPPSRGVWRPLEVRAVVFECGSIRVAVATIDVVGVTREMTDRIRARVARAHGLPHDAVMVVASHTHAAPATLPCMGLRPSREWIDRIEADAAACIGLALANLEPVQIGVGCGEVGFSRSRRPSPKTAGTIPEIDRRVRVLSVVREADRSPVSTLFHYACHPTVMSGQRGLISPDYPGVAREVIEEEIGGTAIFLPGCGGDLRPTLDDRRSVLDQTTDRLEVYGRVLGLEVRRVIEGIHAHASGSLAARRAVVDVPFGAPPSVDVLRALVDEESDLARRLTGPWARRVLQGIEANTLPGSRLTEMQRITIGPVTFVGLPGEPLQAIGRALETRLAGEPATAEIWPIGYANDAIGYFCTPEQYVEGGYETTAYAFYDQPAPFAGELDVILGGAMRLVHESPGTE